jgi:serine/threonine protein kinase
MSGTPEPASLPETIGRGRYRVQSVLGQGGMATVYRVTDSRLGVTRALKVLAPAFAARPNLRRRFEAEARAMAVLSHPNILAVYDVDEDGPSVYIVMELLSGGSVQDVVETRGPLHPAVAADVVRQALLALQVAHDAGVVHRDVKPHNILLANDGLAKLTDFGIAHVGLEGFQDAQTRTGSIMGTWAFMAPEQRLGQGLRDPRVDLYAATATLYSILTARLPGDLHVTEAHDTLFAGIPDPLHAILAKGARYKPEERYPSAAAMAEALAAVIPELGTPPADPLGLAERRAASGPPSQPSVGSQPPRTTPPQAPPASAREAAMRGATFSAGDFDAEDLAQAIGVGPRPTAVPDTIAPSMTVVVPSEPAPATPANAGVSTSTPTTIEPPPGASKRPLIAGVVATLLVIGGAVAVLGGGSSEPAPATPQATPAAGPAAPTPAVGQGVLNITADGMSGAQVWIDEKRVGAAPVVQMVSAGEHAVRVAHTPTGLDETRTVAVGEGETRAVGFAKPTTASAATTAKPARPATEKAATPPREEPKPAPKPVTAPTAAAAPADAGQGRVSSLGAALTLRNGGKTMRVPMGGETSVPVGTWSIEARFDSGNAIKPSAPAVVTLGGLVKVKCSETTETCKVQ